MKSDYLGQSDMRANWGSKEKLVKIHLPPLVKMNSGIQPHELTKGEESKPANLRIKAIFLSYMYLEGKSKDLFPVMLFRIRVRQYFYLITI